MKTSPTFATITVLICALMLSACSRQTLYDNAMAWERSSAGLEPASITVNNMNIAYLRNEERVGGDTLVLIHGFGANKDNWTRIAKELSDEFNIYAIDLPGHGDSSKPLNIGYNFDDQVKHLADILAELNLGKVHMFGNSMGGAITALYAAAYPDQIKSAVLFDPAGIYVYESELVGLVEKGENPLIPSKEGDFERLVNFSLVKKPFVPWPIYDVMEEKAIANEEVNKVIFEALRESAYADNFRDAITGIKAPVLVIWGEEDRVTDPRNADIFVQEIPDARKVLLEGVGHAPMVEVPEKSAQLFREFLAETR